MNKKDYYPFSLLILITIISIITGINPNDRLLWLLEFMMVLGLAILLFFTYKKFRFSNTAYTLMFVLCIFPLIGGYYRFESVPIPSFLTIFQEGRNNFDRFVHILSGVTLSYAFWEYLKRKVKIKGVWLYAFPVMFLFALGGLYEVLEWLVTYFVSDDTIKYFVASQGDVWDAQKDIALAGIGSIFSMIYVYIFKRKKK